MITTIYNSLDASPGFTITGDVEIQSTATSGNVGIRAADGYSVGKYYYEVAVIANAQNYYNGWGITRTSQALSNVWAGGGGAIQSGNGQIIVNQVPVVAGYMFTPGHVCCMATDLDNQRMWFRIDNGNWNNDPTANPATNVGGVDISAATGGFEVKPVVACVDNNIHGTANFGGAAFAFTVPAGFTAGWPGNVRAAPGLGLGLTAFVETSRGIGVNFGLGIGEAATPSTAPSRAITISWLRRNRLAGSTVFVTDNVPMDEALEKYDVEIVVANTIVRSFLGLLTPSVQYTAAQQIADGWTSTPKQLTLRVYQISAVVGRGLTQEVSVNVQ